MTSIIVDDEAAARSRLTRLLAAYPDITLAGEAQDGLEAVKKIEELQPDLLFLDIELPGLTGFEVLESVAESVPLPLVIFVTGYDQHALAAFEANALAYLLKPVEPERLVQAVERARKLNSASGAKQREREHLLQVARESPKTIRQIVCRKRDRLILVPPEDVFWFEVEDGIVRAKTANDSFWVNYQLGELAASLPKDLFFRARREALVNLSKIKEIKPYFKSGFLLIMSDARNSEIVVSERQAPLFRQQIPGL
jgi:DNA-binding LytR/AlgR family response regulator